MLPQERIPSSLDMKVWVLLHILETLPSNAVIGLSPQSLALVSGFTTTALFSYLREAAMHERRELISFSSFSLFVGTWRSEAVCDASSLMKISKDISPEIAACLPVGPVTAVCLLEDFVNLTEGKRILPWRCNCGNTITEPVHL